MLFRFLDQVFYPVKVLGLRLIFLISSRRRVLGFTLGTLSPSLEQDSDTLLDQLTDALRLIQQTDPKRFAQLQRLLPRIGLLAAGGEQLTAGIYLVDAPTLRTRTALEAASAIVHEGTHARLEKWRIKNSEVRRARIEHACVRQELNFLKRNGASPEVMEAKLEQLKNPWWTPEKLQLRRLALLNAHSAPKWLIRFSSWLFRLRSGRGVSA